MPETMRWIKGTPTKDGWYFVWISGWSGLGNKAEAQKCFWANSEWRLGALETVDAPISHYAVIVPPEGE